MKAIGEYYRELYDRLCGVHPNLYPWHFQWLAVKELRADLKRILSPLRGRILDVGCGDKPYQSLLVEAQEYIGLDVFDDGKADIVVDSMKPWPLENDSFDAVLCTQVLEHVADTEGMLRNIRRVIKPGGMLIITAPFIYNAHAIPGDYHRFSIYGMEKLLPPGFEIVETKPQGAIGSSVGVLCLNWIETMSTGCKLLRLLKGTFLPLWIPFCFVVNLSGWLIDKLDKTKAFYSNVLLVSRKPDGKTEKLAP